MGHGIIIATLLFVGFITLVLGMIYVYKNVAPQTYSNYGGKALDYGFYIPKAINWVITIGHHTGGNATNG